jgi:hypothetical protein
MHHQAAYLSEVKAGVLEKLRPGERVRIRPSGESDNLSHKQKSRQCQKCAEHGGQ